MRKQTQFQYLTTKQPILGGIMKKVIFMVALTFIVSSFLFGQTLTWRFRADNPNNIVDPITNQVSSLFDMSGNGRHATQANLALQPLLVTLPEGPLVLRFDGADDYLRTPLLFPALTQPNEIFITWRVNPNIPDPSRRQFAIDGASVSSQRHSVIVNGVGLPGSNVGTYASGTPSLAYSKATPFDNPFGWMVTSGLYDGENSEIWENGVSQVTGILGTGTLRGITIGERFNLSTSEAFDGDIYEIRVYQEKLTDEQRAQVTQQMMIFFDTLPVELSSFNAIVTTQMFVELNWTSETETNMLGYNVYRSEDNVIANAHQINYAIIPAINHSTTTRYSYLDTEVLPGTTYYYWLQSTDLDLTNQFHGPISILVDEQGESGTITPGLETRLKGAYPNPFNPGTTISFSLAEKSNVSLNIFNTKGQLIRTLIDNKGFGKGSNFAEYWDGNDNSGNPVTSGMYLYIMETDNDYRESKKMIMMK